MLTPGEKVILLNKRGKKGKEKRKKERKQGKMEDKGKGNKRNAD